MSWVYIKSEPQLWTVGHYDPSGTWHPSSDHGTESDAADKCHWLNGKCVSHDTMRDALRVVTAFDAHHPECGIIKRQPCDCGHDACVAALALADGESK